MASSFNVMQEGLDLDVDIDGTTLFLVLAGILAVLVISMILWGLFDDHMRKIRRRQRERLHAETVAHFRELMEAELGTAPNWQAIMSDSSTSSNFHIILNGTNVPSPKEIAEKLTLVRKVCPASCWVGKSYQLCCICIEDIQQRSTIRTLECGHVFHSLCIVQWLTRTKPTCPLCHQRVNTALSGQTSRKVASGYQRLVDI